MCVCIYTYTYIIYAYVYVHALFIHEFTFSGHMFYSIFTDSWFQFQSSSPKASDVLTLIEPVFPRDTASPLLSVEVAYFFIGQDHWPPWPSITPAFLMWDLYSWASSTHWVLTPSPSWCCHLPACPPLLRMVSCINLSSSHWLSLCTRIYLSPECPRPLTFLKDDALRPAVPWTPTQGTTPHVWASIAFQFSYAFIAPVSKPNLQSFLQILV